jgi:PAS domain-containing protein
MPKVATARPRGPVSAENLRRLVRNSPLPVMLMQIETLRIVEVSDAFVAVTGRDRASLLAATAPELTEQPETATKSMALVASGIIDGYTRRATFRRPSGELLDRDVHITASTESDRQHAVVSVLPANWSADDAPALAMAAEDDTLTMGTVNGQWVVDRITTGEHPDLAFESGEMLNRSIFVAIHPRTSVP